MTKMSCVIWVMVRCIQLSKPINPNPQGLHILLYVNYTSIKKKHPQSTHKNLMCDTSSVWPRACTKQSGWWLVTRAPVTLTMVELE